MKEITFSELAQLWIETCLVRKSVEERTKEEYKRILNNRVLSELGPSKVNEINGLSLDCFVGHLIDSGYSEKTIRNTMSIIREIFKFAYRKDIIELNPVDKMEALPRLQKSNTIHYFTPHEAKLFLSEVDKECIEYRAIFYLLLFSGARRGELCALTWDDIDFDLRTICIRRAVSYTSAGLVIKGPKTAAGNRTISLPQECFDVLRELYLVGSVQKMQSKYVFKDYTGRNEFIPPQRVTDKFRAILKRHNNSCKPGDELPNIRLHDLRHTSATLLVAQNVDVETVARRLGHSNPAITLNIYAHPMMEADYRASAILSQVIR